MVAAIPLAFIIPAMCYIRLEDGPLLSRKKAPAVILAVFGTIVTIFGTIIIILKVTKRKYLCALTVEMNYINWAYNVTPNTITHFDHQLLGDYII